MNSINIIGRLGRDPESRQTRGGDTIATVSVAVNRGKQDQAGNWMTDWFKVTAFGKQAEKLMDKAAKGDCIGVTGKMVSNPYEDRDGNKREGWEIEASHIDVLTPSEGGGGGRGQQTQNRGASNGNSRSQSNQRRQAPADLDDEVMF